MKDYFKPKNLQEYFSGAVYPDSRYFSGLDRKKTHNENFWPEEFWRGDDFKKGWASHCISDRAYTIGMKKIFPAWVDLNNNLVKIENTAVKILGDIFSFDDPEIKKIIDLIENISGFNNESQEVMKDHLQTMKYCYKKSGKGEISDYSKAMRKTLGEEMAEKVISKAEFFNEDNELLKAIKNFFQEGIKIEIKNISANLN